MTGLFLDGFAESPDFLEAFLNPVADTSFLLDIHADELFLESYTGPVASH